MSSRRLSVSAEGAAGPVQAGRRDWAGVGAGCGSACLPACLHAQRQSGRLRGLPASTVILLSFLIFNLSLPSPERGCCRRWRGGCDSHCRRAAGCKLLSPGSPGRRSWNLVTPHPPPPPLKPRGRSSWLVTTRMGCLGGVGMRGRRPGLPRPRAAPGETRPGRACGCSRASASCRDLSVGSPAT